MRFLLLLVLTVLASAQQTVVQTSKGSVQGVVLPSGNRAWFGIPYARPPVGPLRWAAPVEADAWSGTIQTTQFGPACIQPYTAETRAFYDFPPNVTFSEDCLSINVYSPPNAQGLPTMVFFYGGAFRNGGSSQTAYYGDAFASQNVVLVTLNYRLGWFGFFAHPELSPEQGSGAQGFLDQQLALKWVQTNIANFGGNPNMVTIFGESAGATSVVYHQTTRSSWGYFHRAIAQSSAAFVQSIPYNEKQAEGVTFVTTTLGCSTLACARNISATNSSMLPPETIPVFRAGYGGVIPNAPWEALKNNIIHPGPFLAGNVRNEGTLFVLPVLQQFNATPLSPGLYPFVIQIALAQYADIPPYLSLQAVARYPCSTNTSIQCTDAAVELAGDFLLRCPTQLTIDRKAAQSASNVYSYVYNHAPSSPPIPNLGVFHGSELPFVFDTVQFYNHTPEETILGGQVNSAWAAFGKTGNPSIPSQPAWTPSATLPMWINTGTWSQRPTIGSCSFWESVYSNTTVNNVCGLSYGDCQTTDRVPCCQVGYTCRRHAHGECSTPQTPDSYRCVNV